MNLEIVFSFSKISKKVFSWSQKPSYLLSFVQLSYHYYHTEFRLDLIISNNLEWRFVDEQPRLTWHRHQAHRPPTVPAVPPPALPAHRPCLQPCWLPTGLICMQKWGFQCPPSIKVVNLAQKIFFLLLPLHFYLQEVLALWYFKLILDKIAEFKFAVLLSVIRMIYVKFSFSEKATKMCAIVLMVLIFT